MSETSPNPAQLAADIANQAMYECLDAGRSFRFEAGAGAGKTHSLVKALEYLMRTRRAALIRNSQYVACITYTNVAKDEIAAEVDRDPAIFCDTIHAFCWTVIKGFQSYLRHEIAKIEKWRERLTEVGVEVGDRSIEYSLGYRKHDERTLWLHHDDVITLFVALVKHNKFVSILGNRYPYLFIDEYQDMNADFAKAIKSYCIDVKKGPLIGLFGDHWQKIYRDVCGRIEDENLVSIDKKANFRSAKAIVDVLNHMRPELPQEVSDPQLAGSATVFHTNNWEGQRQSGSHWKGDLPDEFAHRALLALQAMLANQGWDIAPAKSKILMLTHNALAKEQGYTTLAQIFPYNDSYVAKTDPYISFLIDVVEPVSIAYEKKRFGEMFAAMGTSVPAITSHAEKRNWARDMDELLKARSTGAVGDVIELLTRTKRPVLSGPVETRENALRTQISADDAAPPDWIEITNKLKTVSYSEIVALWRYLEGHSPFATKHGVKGAEFENVLVVVGRGWNLYDFNQMLELASNRAQIPANKVDAYERARNLFYVACSRPRTRLCILFTQLLSKLALSTLEQWFGSRNVQPLAF